MKSWEPDQVFEKPDFPRVKRKQDDRAGRSAGQKKQPQAGSPEKADSGPSSDRIKAWTPAALDGARKPLPKKRSSKPQQESGGQAGGSWVPDQDFARADFPRKNGKARTTAGGQETAGAATGPAHSKAAASPASGGSSLPQQYLRELVLTFPDNTVNQLRNWYWAKPGEPRNDPGLAAVHPHERIFIVLASVGKQVTEYIFTMMSPKERANLQAILRMAFQPDAAKVQAVRRAFSQAIRGG